MSDRAKLLLITVVFLAAYYLPLQHPRVQSAIADMFVMLQDYAQKHVLFCLVPAFFIAGAIAVFLSQAAVSKYFGPQANRVLSYGGASVSGTILAVCSCTVLPLFAGIYKRGAGIGPATCFLYSGPAINVLAIIRTARVLGVELGLARALGAIVFAIVTGLLMSYFFRASESERAQDDSGSCDAAHADDEGLPLNKMVAYIGIMVLILIFAAWAKPEEQAGLWWAVYQIKWSLVLPLLGILALMLWRWFTSEQINEWVHATQGFVLQIMPLLFAGVLAAGLLRGMPGTDHGIIPNEWIARAVGGNSVLANLAAALVGAFMYFATLTEVPILQSLIGSGMGKGPALTLLLAGPALSLPNMLVIRSVLGTRRTGVFIAIIVVLSAITGLVYGSLF